MKGRAGVGMEPLIVFDGDDAMIIYESVVVLLEIGNRQHKRWPGTRGITFVALSCHAMLRLSDAQTLSFINHESGLAKTNPRMLPVFAIPPQAWRFN
jgi:hypothetical protein